MKREDPGWFFGGGEEPRQGVWIVEEDQYTILKKKVSRVYAAPPEERKKRIYSTAPSKFTTIDQARFQPKTHLLSPWPPPSSCGADYHALFL